MAAIYVMGSVMGVVSPLALIIVCVVVSVAVGMVITSYLRNTWSEMVAAPRVVHPLISRVSMMELDGYPVLVASYDPSHVSSVAYLDLEAFDAFGHRLKLLAVAPNQTTYIWIAAPRYANIFNATFVVEAVWSVGNTVLESREVSFGARPVVKLLRIGVVRNGSAYRVTQVELLIGNAGNAPLFIAPSTASVSVGGTLCAARLEPLVVFPGSEYAVDLHLSRCLVHDLENVPIVIAIRGYPRDYVANFSADLARYVAR